MKAFSCIKSVIRTIRVVLLLYDDRNSELRMAKELILRKVTRNQALLSTFALLMALLLKYKLVDIRNYVFLNSCNLNVS